MDDEELLLSLSCVIASPFEGDDIADIIDNLYADLDKQVKDHGEILPYKELSPLQRMIKDEED